ncbi:MAG TPA: DNA-processing protein DprA, partial [Acidisoma sp.]|nr:DNA-processing protein DprA [Acidisoma sp.]
MTKPPSTLVDQIRLARTEGVGPIGYRRLLARFGTTTAALEALPALARAAGRATLDLPSRAAVEDEIASVARCGARMLTLDDPDYPVLLSMLADAPPVLTVLGSAARLSGRTLGVVGGRNASLNGQHMAANLAGDLAALGLVIVSGMARGVDAAAHEAALQAADGVTVAAVAGGIDKPYPLQHERLQARIAE